MNGEVVWATYEVALSGDCYFWPNIDSRRTLRSETANYWLLRAAFQIELCHMKMPYFCRTLRCGILKCFFFTKMEKRHMRNSVKKSESGFFPSMLSKPLTGKFLLGGGAGSSRLRRNPHFFDKNGIFIWQSSIWKWAYAYSKGMQ